MSVSLLSPPILAPLQLQFWAQARNKPVNLFQSPGQGKASQRESAIMATAPTTAITRLAPDSPSMFLLTAPQSQTQAPSSSTLTLQLHTLIHPSYTSCFSLTSFHPCAHQPSRNCPCRSPHTLSPLCTPHPHHTLSFTHKCPLACPPHSPLSDKTHRAPLPQGPRFPHTVSTHYFTQSSTQKAPVYVHCRPETFLSQPFPFTVFLLPGPQGDPLLGPLHMHTVHSPSVPSSPDHSLTHTHTHIKHPTH